MKDFTFNSPVKIMIRDIWCSTYTAKNVQKSIQGKEALLGYSNTISSIMLSCVCIDVNFILFCAVFYRHASSLKLFLSLQYLYSCFSMQISNAVATNSCVYKSYQPLLHEWTCLISFYFPELKDLPLASSNQIVCLFVIWSNQHIKCNIYTVQPTYKVQYLHCPTNI